MFVTIRRMMDDERGFLGIYMVSFFMIGCLMIWGVMWATLEGVRKNAMASYQWFDASGQYAMNCANLQGIVSNPEQNQDVVEGYFDDAFSSITQTTCSGNEFDPGTESPFPGPIQLTEFDPVDQGGSLPGGGTAAGPGYVIGMTVPIMIGSIPYLGPESISVPMLRYFQLGPGT